MEALNIDRFVDKLREFDALRDADTVNRGCVDRIQPAFADAWPTILDPEVRDSLVSVGIPRPYHHQAEAIAMSLSGADVVMESPTASGKTLPFTAPMLHAHNNPAGGSIRKSEQADQIRKWQPHGNSQSSIETGRTTVTLGDPRR